MDISPRVDLVGDQRQVCLRRLLFYVILLSFIVIGSLEAFTANPSCFYKVNSRIAIDHMKVWIGAFMCHVMTSLAVLIATEASQSIRVRLAPQKVFIFFALFGGAGLALGAELALLLQSENRLPLLHASRYSASSDEHGRSHLRPTLLAQAEAYAYLMTGGCISSLYVAWSFISRQGHELRFPVVQLGVLEPFKRQVPCSVASAFRFAIMLATFISFVKLVCPTTYWPYNSLSRWLELAIDSAAASPSSSLEQHSSLHLAWTFYLTALAGFLNFFVHDLSIRTIHILLTQPLDFQKLVEAQRRHQTYSTTSTAGQRYRTAAEMLLDGLQIGHRHVLTEASLSGPLAAAAAGGGEGGVGITSADDWQDVVDCQYRALTLKAQACQLQLGVSYSWFGVTNVSGVGADGQPSKNVLLRLVTWLGGGPGAAIADAGVGVSAEAAGYINLAATPTQCSNRKSPYGVDRRDTARTVSGPRSVLRSQSLCLQSWDDVALQLMRRFSASCGFSCSSPVVMGPLATLPLWSELTYILAMQQLASLTSFAPQLRNEIISTNAIEVVRACCLHLDALTLQLQIFAHERDPAVCMSVLGSSEALLAEMLVKGVAISGSNSTVSPYNIYDVAADLSDDSFQRKGMRQRQLPPPDPKDLYRGQHLTTSCLQTSLLCIQGLVNLLGAYDTLLCTPYSISTSTPGRRGSVRGSTSAAPLHELLTMEKCVPAVLNSFAGLSLALLAAGKSMKISSLPPLQGREEMSADMSALTLLVSQALHCVVTTYAPCLSSYRFPPAYAAVINQHYE